MAVIHDVMPTFELYQPASVADALNLLGRYGRDAWVLAGGLDSFDWLKDRIKRPKAVIDLSGIAELQGIRPSGDGLEFALGFEKVRYGDRLEGFEAKWSAAGGWERLALSDNAVVQALMEGKGIAKVAKEFGIGVAKVQKIRDQAKANGIEFEQAAKGGRPKKAE